MDLQGKAAWDGEGEKTILNARVGSCHVCLISISSSEGCGSPNLALAYVKFGLLGP